MEPVIEYLFGTGDGDTTQWRSLADADLDGDGVPDAVWLDFDGDGSRDDAMWDSDGDGIAEVAALDLDDDGTPETFYADGGRGIWEQRVDRPDADQRPSNPEQGTEPAGPQPPPSTQPDPQSVGEQVQADIDTDGDGALDAAIVDGAGGWRLYLDTDGDGQVDRVLVDSDGDGTLDASYGEGEEGFAGDEGEAPG